MLKNYIGDKRFYARVLSLMLPIMLQNGITNFVNMLDNIMVGRVGTTAMTGVAVANQLFTVFNICIFGAVSGAGIFGAQFYGKGDNENLRYSFRFKIVFSLIIGVMGIGVFLLFGKNLSALYLKGEGNAADIKESLNFAYDYIKIMIIGIIPHVIVQCYSSTLRETDRAFSPMVAGFIAVCVNLVFNYLLIFGNFGFPKLGVKGAAIATVISRFVELTVITFWTHKNKSKCTFIVGAYKSFKIPFSLVGKIFAKGFPLMLNESLWAVGMALLNQSYSVKGYDVVAANNISHTFYTVFCVGYIASGSAIGIILGQLLGAGEYEKARNDAKKLITFSVFVSILFSLVFIAFSRVIPQIYNTTASVREMAFRFIIITAICMPLDAYSHAAYFTLRSGGQVFITMIFDSGFVILLMFPTAYFLSRYSAVSIYVIYAICQGESIIKDFVGHILVKEGYWVKTLKA